MNVQEIISSGILELYCAGLTSAAETAEVENWARQYPEVAAELAAIQAALETYTQANAVEPAVGVKEALLNRIRKEKTAPVVNINTGSNGAKVFVVWKYAAAASIVLLVGSLIFSYNFYNKYKSANEQLKTAQTQLVQQQEIARSMHNDMGVMSNKDAMPVTLKGMDKPDDAARIYWMQDTHEVYIDPSNLPKAPDGMQYQFWGIVDGKPVSGGMITLGDGRTVHLQKMKSFGKAEAFAVSLEKAGPEKATPSKVIVMGKI